MSIGLRPIDHGVRRKKPRLIVAVQLCNRLGANGGRYFRTRFEQLNGGSAPVIDKNFLLVVLHTLGDSLKVFAMPWRAMEPDHLPGVRGIADRVHLNYPEDEAVFSERLELYPEGCFVLERARDGLTGYIISHP
ncbi:hypothetical protein [Bradyrhizobium yuanmingense]|uniref:hypothetical protein n=1 Tax=Bradyrhizobium yuanmingense TaxID=108015 RepID=UPI0030845051